MADIDQARKQARLTGAEGEEISRAHFAEELLRSPVFSQALADVAAYYAAKQIDAQHDIDEVMRWQMHRVVLVDVERTLRSYIQTGELAQGRMTMWRQLLERARRAPRKLDRFTFTKESG